MATTLDSAVPARAAYVVLYKDQANSDNAIGGVVDVTISVTKDVRRIYEIGSLKPYLGEGFTSITMSASKLLLLVSDAFNDISSSVFGKDPFAWSELLSSSPTLVLGIYTPSNTSSTSSTISVKDVVLTGISISLTAGDIVVIENANFEAYKIE